MFENVMKSSEASLLTWFAGAVGTLFTLLLLNSIYNRYFHPLSHVPGPFWGSVSDFYKLYIIAKKDAHTRGIAMHKKYGP